MRPFPSLILENYFSDFYQIFIRQNIFKFFPIFSPSLIDDKYISIKIPEFFESLIGFQAAWVFKVVMGLSDRVGDSADSAVQGS